MDMADSNETKPADLKCSHALELTFWILYGCVGVVTFTGNCFTFLVFVTSKRLRQSYMNVFLLNLAVADVMMSTFVVPYNVLCNSCSESAPQFCWLMAGLKDIALGGTVFNLAAISLDRFLAVIRPLHYHNDMTNTRVICILLGVWSFNFILAAIRNTWLHTTSPDEALRRDKIYNSILIFAFALLPLLVMIVMNAKIIQAIRRQNRLVQQERIRGNTEEGNQGSRLARERSKARRGTMACVFVVFIFFVSWLPLGFVNFSFVFGRRDLVSDSLVKVAWLLLLLQSSANPFIYSFFRFEFRQAAHKLIFCRFRRVDIEPTSRFSGTNTN